MTERNQHDDEVSSALRQLPREMTPPSHVATALTSIVTRRHSTMILWRVAVAASLVIGAFAAGRVTAPRAPSPAAMGPKFALLLYGGAVGGGDDRAAEYGAWAVEARRGGRAVSGERLADAAWSAGVPLADPAPLRGFFIVRAADATEALELARRHPHARDGTVIVRPIDTP